MPSQGDRRSETQPLWLPHHRFSPHFFVVRGHERMWSMFFGRKNSSGVAARRASRRYVRALKAVNRAMFDALEPRVLLSAVVTQAGSSLTITCTDTSYFVQIV